MSDQHTAIVGLGYALPAKIRANDDKIFNWLRDHQPPGSDLFQGLHYRRVMEPPEMLVDLMVEASSNALAEANILANDVDLLIGYASISKFNAPNGLLEIHHKMNLPEACRCIAVNTEYTNFLDAMKLANDMIQVGTVKNALVVVGNNWTGHMDYHEAVSIAAGDGAGAAVVGPTSDPARFRLIDWENRTESKYYGAFQMAPRVATGSDPEADYGNFTTPLMKLDGTFGEDAFKNFGMKVPINVVNDLVARNGLKSSDITLIAHQVSSKVAKAWQDKIQAGKYISTLEELADMVSSSQAVNLAKCYGDIETDYLVLMGVGMGMHATAMLYQRGLLTN
jgi:3-oxoacyl-[acyl-carrier-protein] synthase-3